MPAPTPAEKSTLAAQADPNAKQPSPEKPAEAKPKPAPTVASGTAEKSTLAAQADPNAKQPSPEKPAEAKPKPAPTVASGTAEKSTPTAQADPNLKQPSPEKPAEAKPTPAPTPASGTAEKSTPTAQADPNAKQPSPAKPAEAKPKPAPTPASGTAEKSTPTAQADPNAKQPSPAKPAEAKPKPAPTPASGTAEKSTPTAQADPNARQPSPEKPPGLPLAVVPVDLLAYLHAFDGGRVEYDAIRRLFVPTPREPTFERARLYANTIDDVPSVVDKLKERQFAVMSQSTRISEIHQQDFSLRLLVLIVGAGVFLFGVVTVVTVLLDSTERKRGTIGILRVMGVPRAAVFYMVFLRAAVIGSIAAGVTLGLGYLTGQVLGWEPSPDTMWGTWKPIIKVIIKPEDMILVVAGALACCGLGSIIPAFRASRLDPFDAIVEGRFR